ncbi:ORMDL [Canna indica]|uniref:ORMDL n=1 Tax=Canna indica TaxID=4628 RepID=A0AAQ3KFY7_9LILI|nr:ORMDL [Canna indica]
MAKLYVQAVSPADLNKNTEWFMYPGVRTTYILILFFSWLLVLSVFGYTPGTTSTIANLCHFVGDVLGFTPNQQGYQARTRPSRSHDYNKQEIK